MDDRLLDVIIAIASALGTVLVLHLRNKTEQSKKDTERHAQSQADFVDKSAEQALKRATDYDKLLERVSGLEALKSDLEGRLTKAEERVTALERENAELLARIKELEAEKERYGGR